MEASYRLYTEEDAAALSALFQRNRFYLGKTGKLIDPAEYVSIQKKRGLLFAMVAELGGEIIAHVGVYPAGCQRVAGPHEVFMDSFLIDKKYRTKIHSLYEMYARTLYHLYEFYPDVRVMISEVNFVNKESMYLQRQFGGILLGNEADIYGQLELYNFAPALLYMGAPMVRKGKLTAIQSALPPTKKSDYTHVEPVTEDRYVEKNYNLFGEDLTVTLDIVAKNISGVFVNSTGLRAHVLPDGQTLVLENRSELPLQVHIDFLTRECRMVEPDFQTILQTDAVGSDLTVPAGESVRTQIPEGIRSAEIGTDRTDFAFALPVLHEEEPERRCISFEDIKPFYLDVNTGILHVKSGNDLFEELWPCLSVPYITGFIRPDVRKHLKVPEQSPQGCTVLYERDDYDVVRVYQADGNAMKIRTKVLLKSSEAKIEPLFHIILDDPEGRVDFYSDGDHLHSKTCDYERDVKTSIAEMLFLDLLEEPYSKKTLSYVTFDFAGEVWELTADQPFTGFYQHNYLAVNYVKGDPEQGASGYRQNGNEIDFGTLTIRRIDR